jgi:DNA-binding NtrC family response regulator
MSTARILVVEDDSDMRLMLEEELREVGYETIPAQGGEEALDLLDKLQIDIVVTDLMMPGIKGTDLLTQIRERGQRVPVILMTAFGSIESAVDSMRGGAYHYLTKPFKIEQLRDAIERALQEHRLIEPRPADAGAIDAAQTLLVAESGAMRRVLDLVARSAPSDTPVLLLGESGTGKDMLARMLHERSRRRERRFVAVNCSAIPEGLLESQLFGHRRGAFTDAKEDRKGLFQEAEGGSLFLDEIGDMAPALQAKLLRALQEREVHPLGADAPVPVDVRVIAATHRDLEVLREQGRFREDLYYRLNVIAIHVPPLRSRPGDLVPLVTLFLTKHGPRLGRSECTVSPEAMERLDRHSWPGNVRELENVIERALVLGRSPRIEVADLPESLRAHPSVADSHGRVRSLAETEREQIIQSLRSVNGNKAAAARLLGLDRKTLYRKLQSYGIEDP